MAQATKTWKPARVRSEEERRGGGSSQYLSLDEGEKFTGYALFDADPAKDEAGYYEYLEHFHQASRKSIPCAGDDCPLCADGEKPRTRAKTLWLVTRDEKGGEKEGGELRIFNFNWNLIKYFTEMRVEGDKIKGRMFRVSRLDDRGNYAVLGKDDKITATAVKEAVGVKDAPDFDQMVTSQLRKGLEGIAVARALDADDDVEEEAATSTTSKGKSTSSSKGKTKKEGWPDEAEELAVTVASVDDENSILVNHDEYGEEEKVWGTDKLDLTGLEEGANITIDYFTDDDKDKVATAFEETEPVKSKDDDETTVELPKLMEGEEFEVVGETDETNGTIPVENEDYTFDLYILESMKLDFDDYKVGTKILVTAKRDSAGDMCATEIPEIQGSSGKKGGSRKKG